MEGLTKASISKTRSKAMEFINGKMEGSMMGFGLMEFKMASVSTPTQRVR